VARVVVYVPDLLFGSNVVGALHAAGHEPQLVSDLDQADLISADVLIVDLTADFADRVDAVRARLPSRLPTVAFYSHVEVDVRAIAEREGFTLVVPRSRMAREAGALVDRALTANP
jgi:hypothetical protein